MKKFNIMASLLLGALLFTGCDADRDDNPVLDLSKPQQPIKLNTPTFANGTYDLENSESIELTCTQPSYGFPATATYVVQLSVDEDMSKPNELTTTYSSNKMNVSAKELAIATTKQLMEKRNKKQEDFPIEETVYLRIRAFIAGVTGTEALSNIVKLNKVKTKFALPDVSVPNPFYFNGKFNGNDWEKAVESVPVNGDESTQWRIAYIDTEGVQVSPVAGAPNYEEDMITTTYTCSAAGFSVSDEGIIKTNTPGWYTVIISGKVDNDKRTMNLTFSFSETEVWLIGTSIINSAAGITADNCWSEADLRNDFTKYVKFETPTEMNGEFVSPELTSPVDGDGGTRAYVKVKNNDWWKTEFFVFDKQIVYRGNGGDQERVNGKVGQKVYLNFSNDTGDLK